MDAVWRTQSSHQPSGEPNLWTARHFRILIGVGVRQQLSDDKSLASLCFLNLPYFARSSTPRVFKTDAVLQHNQESRGGLPPKENREQDNRVGLLKAPNESGRVEGPAKRDTQKYPENSWSQCGWQKCPGTEALGPGMAIKCSCWNLVHFVLLKYENDIF